MILITKKWKNYTDDFIKFNVYTKWNIQINCRDKINQSRMNDNNCTRKSRKKGTTPTTVHLNTSSEKRFVDTDINNWLHRFILLSYKLVRIMSSHNSLLYTTSFVHFNGVNDLLNIVISTRKSSRVSCLFSPGTQPLHPSRSSCSITVASFPKDTLCRCRFVLLDKGKRWITSSKITQHFVRWRTYNFTLKKDV